jgi:predicted ABC-type ATPase
MFSGPNGSGKSMLFEKLKNEKQINTGIYISADRIENDLKTKKKFIFNAYRVKSSQDEFFNFIQNNGLWKSLNNNIPSKWFNLKSGILTVKNTNINSYLASFIAGYLIEKILPTKQSFCFETVMSHKSKLDLFTKSKINGYKTYLYFIYTTNVEINILRIQQRIKAGGHDVPLDKIKSRYSKSLSFALNALENADTAFILDNTNNDFNKVAEKISNKTYWLDLDANDFFKLF